MNLKLLYFFFLGIVFNGFAQKDSLQNPYFKTYIDKITASAYYVDTSNNFQMGYNVNGEKKYINLNPSRREQLGLGVSYQFVDLNLGFSPKFFEQNKDNSDSKLFSLSTRFYYKKWVQSFIYIDQKGFYAKEEDSVVSFPKMHTTKIGGSTSYVFNDKFSYKMMVSQDQWQTKSSGSFIPSFSFYYTSFNLNITKSNPQNIYTFSLAPSYFYNFVINKCVLIGSGIALGAGLDDINGDTSALFQLDLNFKIAYNTDRFFAFASFNSINFFEDTRVETPLNDNISTFKLSIGYRFKAPKKVKKIYEIVNKKTGL